MTIRPISKAFLMRSGVTRMMRALVWLSVVMIPLCEPVKDTAG